MQPPPPLPPAPAARVYRKVSPWLVATLLAAVLLLGLAIVGLMVLVIGLSKDSQPYRDALAAARAHPQVRAALGQPIEDAWIPSGSIALENDEGHADLLITLHGPQGRGRIRAIAERHRGRWQWQELAFQRDGSSDWIELDASGGAVRAPPAPPSLDEPSSRRQQLL